MDLIDPFGRTIRDLRLSVTDRCNFRCTYCMPHEGVPLTPAGHLRMKKELKDLVNTESAAPAAEPMSF